MKTSNTARYFPRVVASVFVVGLSILVALHFSPLRAPSKSPFHARLPAHLLYSLSSDVMRQPGHESRAPRPLDSIPRSIALGVISYQPIAQPNSNFGDWYQSAAALYAWWTFLTNSSTARRPRTAHSVYLSIDPSDPYSFHSFVQHAVDEDGLGGSNNTVWPRIKWMERDSLQQEELPRGVTHVIVMMNAWWMAKRKYSDSFSFPPPAWVIPILVSMHVSNTDLLAQNGVAEYLREQGPVGARDEATRDAMRDKGVDAYFSGCITPLLRLEDDGCAGFDHGGRQREPSEARACAVEAPWDTEASPERHYTQVPNELLTRSASNVMRSLTGYCSEYRWCSRIHATRLHVWFPLHMNGYNATLFNRNDRAVIAPPPPGAGHPGVGIDGHRTNRFAGLLEATAGDHGAYITRLLDDVLGRMGAALEEAKRRCCSGGSSAA